MITTKKLTRRTCDRCANWIEYGEDHDYELVAGWKTLFSGFDLCPQCATSLMEWMDGPRLGRS